MKEAELLIKQRAREKYSELFYEIEHLDLIAKNFWFHSWTMQKIFYKIKEKR